MRHDCKISNGNNWAHCSICEGRIHLEGCTSRRKAIDCTEARHKRLLDAGYVRGLCDTSFIMWTPEHPLGLHSPSVKEV